MRSAICFTDFSWDFLSLLTSYDNGVIFSSAPCILFGCVTLTSADLCLTKSLTIWTPGKLVIFEIQERKNVSIYGKVDERNKFKLGS